MKIAQALEAQVYDMNEKSLDAGVGGREGALIRLSREWAEQGHEVTNYVHTSTPHRVHTDSGGFFEFVPYRLSQTCLATFEYDACVAWECPEVFADERIVERNPVRLIEMQCAHLSAGRRDAAAEFATGIVGLSQWAVDFLAHEEVEGPFYVLPNGVDLADFPWEKGKRITFPRSKKFVYSSSPDRGLLHLLRLWPTIRNRYPDAELKIAYGAQSWLANQIWAHNMAGSMAVEITNLMGMPGVIDVGKVSQKEVAKLHRESTMLAYPCDTIQPTETGCITIIEAMAAGKPVVTTDCDCLEEEFGSAAAILPLPFVPETYWSKMVSVMEDRKVYFEMAQAGRELAEGRQWRDIAQQWINLFESQR